MAIAIRVPAIVTTTNSSATVCPRPGSGRGGAMEHFRERRGMGHIGSPAALLRHLFHAVSIIRRAA
jgi:hypothetical protein